jgi:hypothetical protein
MKLPRREFLHLAGGAAALPALPRIAQAETYPMRPVRIVVGYAAGGGADIVARVVGQWLSERLGPFIVENRPGAGSNLGAEAVVRAPPDGYTLLLVTLPANAINATPLRQPRVRLRPQHRAARKPDARSQRHAGHALPAGHDDPRFHRLCQRQSGQDQHDIGRHRVRHACSRRIVQGN